MHLQLSVIHTRALLHSTWDMTFHQTQSFIWKTLTRSKWKADLISSIFQMRKQAYWSKNNLPEVSSWLHTSSSLCSSGPVQSLPQKPQTAYRVIRPVLLTWSLEGELEEIREKRWLLYVLHLQPQSHSGFLSWVFLFGSLLSVGKAPPSCSLMRRKALEWDRLDSLLSAGSSAMLLNISQSQEESHHQSPPRRFVLRMKWTYMETGGRMELKTVPQYILNGVHSLVGNGERMPFANCVTLGQLLSHSVTWFPHL